MREETENDGDRRRESATWVHLAVIAVGEPFFLLALPWLFAVWGRQIDRNESLPRIAEGYSLAFGLPLIAVGLFFAIWSIGRLFTIGGGTPLPLVPPRKLVVQPPYSYCRNPMAFGIIFFYFGFALAAGSVGALALVAVFAVGLLVYIRSTEEYELRERFGERYSEYRNRTPFFFPRFWRRFD